VEVVESLAVEAAGEEFVQVEFRDPRGDERLDVLAPAVGLPSFASRTSNAPIRMASKVRAVASRRRAAAATSTVSCVSRAAPRTGATAAPLHGGRAARDRLPPGARRGPGRLATALGRAGEGESPDRPGAP
jgi:hypothetical protein